jgi:pilus assembly protein Flp/PilA
VFVTTLSIWSTTVTEGNPMLIAFVELQNWISSRIAQIDERGATAVEYALMVGLIALAIIGSVSLFGRQLRGELNRISNTLPG